MRVVTDKHFRAIPKRNCPKNRATNSILEPVAFYWQFRPSKTPSAKVGVSLGEAGIDWKLSARAQNRTRENCSGLAHFFGGCPRLIWPVALRRKGGHWFQIGTGVFLSAKQLSFVRAMKACGQCWSRQEKL